MTDVIHDERVRAERLLDAQAEAEQLFASLGGSSSRRTRTSPARS